MSNPNEKKVQVNITLEQVNIILSGLSKMEYGVVATLVEEIRNQVVPQLQGTGTEN